MKIVIFVAILIAGVLLIPDRLVGSVIDHLIDFPGDGEEGMNNYEFTILLIKLMFSAIVAFLVLRRLRFAR